MLTVRCSSCLLVRGYLPRGIVCPGVSAQGVGGWCLPGGEGGCWCIPACTEADPPVDRILDTRLWKHYLSATSFADGNNGHGLKTVTYKQTLISGCCIHSIHNYSSRGHTISIDLKQPELNARHCPSFVNFYPKHFSNIHFIWAT